MRQEPKLAAKTRASRRKWAPSVLSFVLCLVCFFLFWRLHDQRRAPPAEVAQGALTVTTEIVRTHRIPQELLISGLISAWDPISVGSEVSGLRIQTVDAEEGQTVRQGQVLAVLDSRLLLTNLEEAWAQVRAGQAGLAKAIQPNRVEDIKALRSALFAAEARIAQEDSDSAKAIAQLEQAKISANRFRRLAEQGAVSAQDAENAETLVKTTTAELHACEQRVQSARFAADQVREHLTMARAGGRR